MSAEDRWHKHAPVKSADPIISPTILLWLREQGSEDLSAMPWHTHPEDAFRSEPAPDSSPDSEEVLANLLRAIENTDVASRLRNVAPRENGHASAANSAEPASQAASMLREPPQPEVGRSESISGVGSESNEAITNLLRAIEGTDIAATLEVAPQAEYAERAGFGFAQPAATAETPTTLPQAPEMDASGHLPAAALDAPEAGESSAVLVHEVQSIDADLLDRPVTAADTERAEIVSSVPIDSAESTSISAPPVARPDKTPFKQEKPQPRRVSRRRHPSRQRSDYLLSIATPAVEPSPRPAAGEPESTQAAEPLEPAESAELLPVVATTTIAEPETTFSIAAPAVEPSPCPAAGEPESTQAAETLEPAKSAEPLPVVATTTIAEPETTLTAEPAVIADAPRLPAATDDFAPKTPLLARLGTEIKSLAATGELINGGLDRAEMRLENWFQKWFGPIDPRHTTRVDKPPLVAYHWIVDAPQALKVANISAGGLHLITKDRWSEGNIVSMTLQRTDKEKGSAESWIAVDFLVMRWCEDGMAGAFMPSAPGLVHTVAGRAGNCADKKTLDRFVKQLIDATARRAAATK